VNQFEFEGDAVTDFLGVLPKIVVECPEAYPRGTLLSLNVEVRVRSVNLEETRKGDLVRKHVFAIEAITVKDKVDPQAVVAELIGGNATEAESVEHEPVRGA
jgi:hypothetical protein